MAKSPKQVRVLYTNGENTYVLYSISHTGTDLYHSVPGYEKSSYHGSGVKHTKTADGQYLDRNKEFPLPDVPFRQLISMGFKNSNADFSDKKGFQKASGKKAHGSLIIDSRSIPEGADCELNIGLIASNNLQMLHNILNIHSLIPDLTTRKPKQVLLYTAETPWIYAILSY